MGRDIKRQIFFIFFSPSGKYQVMMLRPSHNSVIEAEACVAAGFGAWPHWDSWHCLHTLGSSLSAMGIQGL